MENISNLPFLVCHLPVTVNYYRIADANWSRFTNLLVTPWDHRKFTT